MNCKKKEKKTNYMQKNQQKKCTVQTMQHSQMQYNPE